MRNMAEQEKVDDALFAILRALRKWQDGDFNDEDAALVIQLQYPVLKEVGLVE